MMSKTKRFIITILGALCVIATPSISFAATFAPHAKAAVLYDETSKTMLFSKNANEVLPLASLTKIVAIYTFLQFHPTTSTIVKYKVADEELNALYCDPSESGKLNLKDGDTLSIKDLIYSSLMMSTNNTVETLARVSGISRTRFIAEMNAYVRAWGAKSTHFIEPTGLSPKNVSTAHDYALITAKVYKSPTIHTASTTVSYSFKTRNTGVTHQLSNVSTLLRNQEYPITAVKTGFLDEAEHCLMTRISTDKGPMTAVLFGVKYSQDELADMRSLLNYAQTIGNKN